MDTPSPTTERLQELFNGPADQDFDLAEAVLLIAKDEYPSLDVTVYLRRLDELAADIKERLNSDASDEETILAMNELLFEDQGFCGNTDDYYDPRNSFLNDVLDRKLGIPITLSIVYMEVGNRVGLPLEGVAFPLHFLVKLATEDGDVVLDPFAGGICLSEEDLIERLEDIPLDEDLSLPTVVRALVANPANKKQVVARMLRNLKAIYLQKNDYQKALAVIDRLLMVTPRVADELRDRAAIYEQLECFRSALENYQEYVRLDPDASDAKDVHRRIIHLRRLVSGLN